MERELVVEYKDRRNDDDDEYDDVSDFETAGYDNICNILCVTYPHSLVPT